MRTPESFPDFIDTLFFVPAVQTSQAARSAMMSEVCPGCKTADLCIIDESEAVINLRSPEQAMELSRVNSGVPRLIPR
jgi:hypothetical protein